MNVKTGQYHAEEALGSLNHAIQINIHKYAAAVSITNPIWTQETSQL